MPVNITQYRGSVGIFNKRNFVFRPKFTNFIGRKCWSTNHLYLKLHLPIFPMNLALFLVFLIVVLSPRCSFYITSRNTCTSMLVITGALLFNYLWFTCNSFCYVVMLNLNSIAAHNFAKLGLLKAYNSIQKSDIIFLSETYLD